jgi:hypothetical protein
LQAGGVDHAIDIERALAAQPGEEARTEIGQNRFGIVRIGLASCSSAASTAPQPRISTASNNCSLDGKYL